MNNRNLTTAIIIVALIMSSESLSVASRFVRKSFEIQHGLAKTVGESLKQDIYIYDSLNAFKDKPFKLINGVRYQTADDARVAVLSATAKETIPEAQAYTTYLGTLQYKKNSLGIFIPIKQ